MEISLSYADENDNLGYAFINTSSQVIFFDKDRLNMFINKELINAKIGAEVVLHEINEAQIAITIRDTLEWNSTTKIMRVIAHNLNAESLGEYEKRLDVKRIFFYRKSDRLADIDGKRHKNTLNDVRKIVYGVSRGRESKP